MNFYADDVTRCPSEVLAGTGDKNPLFKLLTQLFGKYSERGIVCTKTDLVCHSMGGLMARKFLEEKGKDLTDGNNWSVRSYKQRMVRRVVNIATPHRGRPLGDVIALPGKKSFIRDMAQYLYEN